MPRLLRYCFSLLLLGLLLSPAAGEPFRFAFVSDTHIGSATAAADLRATVADINASTGLSFVIISGDITEYGTREQLRSAKAILDELKIPYHLIPGNHDTKWSESGATDFSRIWPADRFLFRHGGMAFIGLHQGPLMRMGDGHWAPQDVRWLESTLRSMPDTNEPIVFVTHYPINDGIANWYVVLDLLKQRNVQAVLCGHGHANRGMNFEGVPAAMGRSNLRAKAPVGGYNLVEVQEGVMTFAERAPAGETKPPWHKIRLERHDFASDTNRYPRPDYSVNARFPAVKPRWRVQTGFTTASSPAVAGQLAIAGDASGAVRAWRLADGQEAWSFRAGNAVYSTPDVQGDRVAVASTDGSLYLLNTADGKVLWKFATDRPIVAAPLIHDEAVLLGSSEGKFRSIDLPTGRLKWEWSGAGNFIETRPLVVDGKVLFGAWDEHFYALDLDTGRLAWKWKGDKAGALLSPAACWPVASGGRVFVVAPDRQMTALDLASGREVWRTANFMVRETIGISADGRRVYVREMRDFFRAFDTRADKPIVTWERKADFGYDINAGMMVEKDGVVFYGTKNGVVYALRGSDGALLWQHKLGPGIVNTVVPLSRNRVLATDFDGSVALLENTGN
jgi:outer membrane protein assembly factor BamB/predicted phosphodiesterase